MTYQPWRDPSRSLHERVEDLLGRMTLEERVGQLASAWVSASGSETTGAAPMQHELTDNRSWHDLIHDGLGQITRPFGTAPVEPADGLRWLAKLQSDVMGANRFAIPALTHEECLTGFTAFRATIYPTPLSWGATFDPSLVTEMGAQIGGLLRDCGIHQGLAPVLDVCRDPRWGRTEETIGEDPYLVATVGTGYITGLQSAGIVATGKHFVGYSGSRAGRNFAPVATGPRELHDVYLVPWAMAVHTGGLRSIMHSYAEIDGVPAASDESLLTGLLRDEWGFTGTVVADYFGIAFLQLLHGIAGSPAEAARFALTAGVDVELPGVRCYGEPLLAGVRTGRISEELVQRAARRVLLQKAELGLLDPDWTAEPQVADLDFDPPSARHLARRVAEESIILLANDGVLPLRPDARIAVIGPQANSADAMLGCYTYPRHIGLHHPGREMGVSVPTLLEALRAELPRAALASTPGCAVRDEETGGFAAAIAAAQDADVCVVALGDIAGLFGRGTSGEGCDVTELRLPGVQEALLDAILETGKPTVLVLLTGRPYALGRYADRVAAIVQAFFPGEEGAAAVAGVLAGRVNPSGHLPVSVPRVSGGQPATYLTPKLGHATEVSTVDPTALYPFGHGLSYTTFDWTEPTTDLAVISTDGRVEVGVTVTNTGSRAGTDVVQLYLHDPVAQVTRPVNRLIGYARVPLEPGASARLTFTVHADLSSFTGRAGRRIVEPGDLELRLGASSGDIRHALPVCLTGPERTVDHTRHLVSEARVSPA